MPRIPLPARAAGLRQLVSALPKMRFWHAPYSKFVLANLSAGCCLRAPAILRGHPNGFPLRGAPLSPPLIRRAPHSPLPQALRQLEGKRQNHVLAFFKGSFYLPKYISAKYISDHSLFLRVPQVCSNSRALCQKTSVGRAHLFSAAILPAQSAVFARANICIRL